MQLPADELKRRIEAARILRGISQKELGDRFAEDGLGKHDPGRIERGTMTMQRAHRDAFVRHLRVPDYWFTDQDVDVLVGLATPPRLSPEEARRILGRLLAGHDQASGQAQPGTQTQRDDADPRTRASGGGDA